VVLAETQAVCSSYSVSVVLVVFMLPGFHDSLCMARHSSPSMFDRTHPSICRPTWRLQRPCLRSSPVRRMGAAHRARMAGQAYFRITL
jgi:hypothetical protein